MSSIMDTFYPNKLYNREIIKTSPPPYVCTHNGVFHADELLAIAILEIVYHYVSSDQESAFEILRTRDPKVISKDDNHLNVDVGGKYDGITNFDHHQADYTGPMWVSNQLGDEFRMAAVGQIWLKYGATAVLMMMCLTEDQPHISDLDTCLTVVQEVGKILGAIDAIDNGRADLFPMDPSCPTLAHVLATLNTEDSTDNNEFEFILAKSFAKRWLTSLIRKTIHATVYANRVQIALRTSKAPILVLPEPGPWVHVYCQDPKAFDDFDVVIYQSAENDWRVQTVPNSPDDLHSMKCPAPEIIRGKRGEDLVTLTDVQDATFVHPTGFIGGATTFQGAKALAHWWIEIQAVG